MKNKVKLAALVAVVIAGMVLYKTHYDKHHKDDKKSTKN